MTPEQDVAVRFLLEHPAEYGHMLGYKDLREDLHGDWIKRMLIGRDDMTLQSHRGSYKTTCLSIAIAINCFLRGDINTIFIRKTDNDAVEVIKQVRRILEHPVTQTLYTAITGRPLQIIKGTFNELTTSAYTAPRGAAQLIGIGINGAITGKHADRIMTDDIVNQQDRISRAERERTKLIYQELQNIKNRGGRIINTGTPWHKEDAFSLMPNPIKWDCYQTGLIESEQLDKLRRQMNPSLFAANYELRHIAIENALFSKPPEFFSDETILHDGIAHIDAAYGGEDYTAFTCGVRAGDTLYMYGKLWRSHVDTVLGRILSDCDRLMCEPIYCETNGDKGFLAKQIRAEGNTVHPYAEKQNKYSKIATYLQKWWGNIKWLEGTDADYIAQIMDYTEDAEHDDAPDSAACVCRILDRESRFT